MKPITIAFLMLFGASQACAQYAQGSIELSVLGGVGAYSLTGTNPSASSGGSPQYLFLSIAPAYYILDGLAVEPEMRITSISPDDGKSGYSLIANLAYTYRIHGDISPYIRLGYGISDGVQAPVAGKSGHINETMNMFNSGMGVKIRITDHASIRTEINYRTPLNFAGSLDHSYTDTNVQVGLTLQP